MSLNSLKIKFIVFVLIIILPGCEDLDIQNLNDPEFETVCSSPDYLKETAGSLINNWFMTTHEYRGWALPLLGAADAGTSSWTYMRPYSNEPRLVFDNHPSSYTQESSSNNYYGSLYKNIASSNNIINLLNTEGSYIDDTQRAMISAVAWFAHGISIGYIGLVYDKAFIVTDETDITREIDISSYKDIIATAVLSLDRTIEICNSNSFTIPSEWLPGETWNNEEFGQLASSFAARLLVYSSRNKTDDNETDWSEVYAYAASGIKKDFAPLADDDKWHSYYHAYANYSGFTQTDMYVVNMMDPAMPSRWVDADTWDILPEPVTSHKDGVDDRIFTDFQYLSSCSFRPERGYYHFSCYRYKRLDQYLTTWTEPMPEFRKAENDYLLAEAAAHTGKIQEAADIINTSPRVTRGGLPQVPADQDCIFDAIHQERMVELMSSGMGIQFFQMRKEDKLQPGSPLHYPIPGSQLEIMEMEYYTFGGTAGETGGVEGIPGIDYSTGGW